MNRNEMEGNWKQLKGHVRKKWGELSDDDVAEVKGDRDILIGKIQERYGKAQAEAAKEVDEWLERGQKQI